MKSISTVLKRVREADHSAAAAAVAIGVLSFSAKLGSCDRLKVRNAVRHELASLKDSAALTAG